MQSAMPSPAVHSSTITLLIGNMHCTSCSDAITYLLSRIPSVRGVSTSLLLRTVTFSVANTLQSSSSSQTPTAVKVVEEVMATLTAEGGFTILAEPPDGSSVATAFSAASRNDTHGGSEPRWLDKLGFSTKSGRERKRTEERRRKHLEHCEVCREEERKGTVHSETEQPSQSKADAIPTDRRALSSPPQSPAAGRSTIKTTLSIEGMTCASCTSSITTALKSHPDIISVDINLLGASGVVRHIESLTSSSLISLVEDVGFDVHVVESIPELSANPTENDGRHLQKSTFLIEGMTCASCTGSINSSLQDQEGIESVHVDLLGSRGVIFHSSNINVETIKDLIEEVGFGAELTSTITVSPKSIDSPSTGEDQEPRSRTISIKVEGMFCESCVTKINSHLDSLPLISYTPLSLSSPTISVVYAPNQPLNIRQILRGLTDLAPEFEAAVMKRQSLSERSRVIQRKEVHTLAAHSAVAVIFAIPTFVDAIVGMILVPSSNSFKEGLMQSVWGAANLGTVILWPLATIVQFGVGRLFYSRAFASIRPHLRALVPSALRPTRWSRLPSRPVTWRSFFSFGSMDLLVVLSTTVSYFASIAMLVLDIRAAPGTKSVGTYFDSCVFLIMFILLGRTLEAYAKSRTTDAVSLLGTLRPDTALLFDFPIESTAAISWNASSDGSSAGGEGTGEESSHPIFRKAMDLPVEQVSAYMRPVSVDHLEVGDIILVQPGSLPPTDGIIVSGQTTFDESSLTGESRPVTKKQNDEIFTGTINKTSAITVRVTRLAADTMLERIIHAVSDATSRKAPLEKLAEKLTGVFVPIIVYFSLVVLAVWLSLSLTDTVNMHDAAASGGKVFFALEFAIATLVVACPCGIGLAVPCANAVGNGVAARAGILVSGGGEAFLAATKVTKVVFDKTGTLTVGKSTVTDEELVEHEHFSPSSRNDGSITARDMRQALVERAVIEVERGSTHPLATALVEYLEAHTFVTRGADVVRTLPIKVISSTEVPGRGLKASIKLGDTDHINTIIGNAALMTEHGIRLTSSQDELLSKWSGDSKSVILVGIAMIDTGSRPAAPGDLFSPLSRSLPPDNETVYQYDLCAMYALADPARPTSKALLANLRALGLSVSMLSGDNENTARAVGRNLGLREGEVKGGVGPEGKAEVIRLMQNGEDAQRGTKARDVVMFVGDGLNDSVALAAADVSVAMGHGSQATLASADFVLLSSELTTLLPLLSISRRIIRRQRLNLLWAIIFNVVCIPFAAGVFYAIGGKGVRLTPVWSAVLMALSSVSVVGSSLALRWGI